MPRAAGVEYEVEGTRRVAYAWRETILSAGAVGSPQILLLSGVGPKEELEAVGVECRVDARGVGKHLKDHLEVGLVFPAPGIGISTAEADRSMEPAALAEWAATGRGLASSSLYEACAFFSTGLRDDDTYDAEVGISLAGGDADFWRRLLRIEPDEFFDDPEQRLAPDAQSVTILATPSRPHSEGEIVVSSTDPFAPPDIRMNYYDDDRDLEAMVAVLRRGVEIAAHWPLPDGLGPLLVPPALAEKHGHSPGDPPGDALLADLARHYSCTVYHLTSTCRIGSVVDPELRVYGVDGLRVADASVMPDIVGGNTNATTIMIGEKAAELIAAEHGVALARFVGRRSGAGGRAASFAYSTT